LGCVDKVTGEAKSGCQFQIQPLALGTSDPYSNGGHTHTDSSRPFILGGSDAGFKYDGAIHSVDSDGQALPYYAPIVSGDVVVKISGFDSQGSTIDDAPPITFRVKVPGLVPLSGDTYNLKCVANPGSDGCPARGYQHLDFYNVRSDVGPRMSKIATDYDKLAPSDEDLTINDASLKWGGLYDIDNDWESPRHTYHRQGTDVDIRRPPISDEDNFERVVCKNDGYPYEEDDAHFHLFFEPYQGADWIKGLCKDKGASQ
ncbi:MAG: hypothetical protein HY075_08975, partial [Deltaproteobacteria bacterium]|nr:hypothetical protein [Deltaproteobacteria bacterium]